MAEASKSNQEPSMEEILSSIRRIIADEEGGDTAPSPSQAQPASTGPAAAAPPPPTAEEDEEVLELTEIADFDEPEPPLAAAPAPPRMAAPPAPAQPLRKVSESPKRSTAMPAEGDSLLSPTTASASTHSLAKLARAAAGNGPERSSGPLAELTVERLLVDLLTPMLRDWLDQNLPAIVERLVEEEVKKLARRAELL